MHDDKYGVVHCVRSSAQPDKKGKELKKWREKKTLDLSDVMTTEHSVPWVAYPGLFARNGRRKRRKHHARDGRRRRRR